MLTQTKCVHCGEDCDQGQIEDRGQYFCCIGCRAVYELLQKSDCDQYYRLQQQPGLSPKNKKDYSFLDHDDLARKLIKYEIGDQVGVEFLIPSMHCISCIWLLEHLFKLDDGIQRSDVNFEKKTVLIRFDQSLINLRGVVELLVGLGYEPQLELRQSDNKNKESVQPVLRLVIAGLCFGNIMLFSFPAYFGLAEGEHTYFHWLNFVFSLPVFFYSGRDYAKSVPQFFVSKRISLDLPVYLGMCALFAQSCYELFSGNGNGYWDSLSGLVFFLLLGRYFQNASFSQFVFDRDYRSFFPVWAKVVEGASLKTVPIEDLKVGQTIQLRPHEVLPCDGLLLSDETRMDYSFVSGESDPVVVRQNARMYAGGKVLGKSIQVCVEKDVSRSYLTSLWEEMGEKPGGEQLSDKVAKVFTPLVVILGFLGALTSDHPIQTFTAVVIVACPCALALAAPLTLGFANRALAEAGLFLKKAEVIEKIARVKHVLFDKTGTLTQPMHQRWEYQGEKLNREELEAIKSVCHQSLHPLSVSLCSSIHGEFREVDAFMEEQGKGVCGRVAEIEVQLGSSRWLQVKEGSSEQAVEIAVKLNGFFKGRFIMLDEFRPGIFDMLAELPAKKTLVSGDREKNDPGLNNIFTRDQLFFRQSPKDKLNVARRLSSKGSVMMVGDGLNDAGALQACQVGVVVVEDHSALFPASDAVVQGEDLLYLPRYLKFSGRVLKIIQLAFFLSFTYNTVGLYFALTGALSPLVSAILMPLSSLSIFFTSACGIYLVKRSCLKKK